VLRGVDLDVAEGEMVAIVGASGSGKSTLLYVAGGLDRDFGGEAVVAGVPLAGLSAEGRADLRNRAVGFVFQSFNLLQGLSARENVMLPGVLRRGRPEAPREIRARAERALASVGLAEKADEPPARLSGGERQRVAIARALSVYPPILLADEPTGNLDTHSGEEILGLIQDLHGRLGSTVVIVTHDMHVAQSCERTIALRDGRVVEDVRRS
jgi:putative ABC transport system ATP-binding protein